MPTMPALALRALVLRALIALAAVQFSLFAASVRAAAEIELTDLAGRTVRVPAKVERLLLGEGRLLPALAILEHDDPTRRLAGMMGEFELLDPAGYEQWRRRFPRLENVPRIGRSSSGSFSVEQAIAVRPQVAIFALGGGHGPGDRDREAIERLQAAGTAVVFVDFRREPLRNTPRSIRLLGALLGEPQRAEAFAAHYEAQLTRVTDRLARAQPAAPTVFLENRVGLSEGCCDTMVGLVGHLLDAAGGSNVARGLVPGDFGTLNPEWLIARQPQFYIGTGIGSLAGAERQPLRVILGPGVPPEAARASLQRAVQRRGIARLHAVQEGRGYAIWHHFYNSPFNVVAVQVFAKWLHPELFADLDPQVTLDDFYARFQPLALDGTYWISLR